MIGYVYVIYCEGEICYVGSTVNMKQRWTHYKSQHLLDVQYPLKINKYMREKGFDKFKYEIVESYEIENRRDLNQYEGMWETTFKELGFELKNNQQAGNGSGVRGTQGYET